MAEQQERSIVQHGDYLVDEDTGEIVDIVVPFQEDLTPFLVCDQSSAEWVMERIFEAESQWAAIIGRRAILLENIDRMEAEAKRRVDWLRWRFGPELEGWAQDELAQKKARSLKTPFGTLSFRRKPARRVITDEPAVLDWAKRNAADAVKVTEKVLVSMLPDGEAIPGTQVEPESDTFSIKTGLL